MTNENSQKPAGISVKALSLCEVFIAKKESLSNYEILSIHIKAMKIDLKNKTLLKIMLLIPFICFTAYSTEMSMASKALFEVGYVLLSVLLVIGYSKKINSDYQAFKDMLPAKEKNELNYLLSVNQEEVDSIINNVAEKISEKSGVKH